MRRNTEGQMMEDRLFGLSDVEKITGLRGSTIHSMTERGKFPARVMTSRKHGKWRESEVLAFMAARKMTCEVCGDVFDARRSNSRYCGHLCGQRAHHAANRDRINAKQRDRLVLLRAKRIPKPPQSRDEVLAKKRAYREKNREKINAGKRSYRLKNIESLRAKDREHLEENRDRINAQKREAFWAKRDQYNAKNRAKKRIRKSRIAMQDALLAIPAIEALIKEHGDQK